jgi:predicted Rossmann fold nucleotide-binding protein DprA/Smf involved in DNA uptake
MRKRLRCTTVFTRSLPNVHQLSARLGSLYDGSRPVTTQQLAEVFGVEPNAIIPVLYRAELRGIIRSCQCRGWIPVS